MGGPRVGALLVVTAFLATACSERQSDSPTAPDLSAKVQPAASPIACNFNTVSTLTKTEFGPSSAQAKLASDMKTAGSQTATATSIGFQLLSAIATKYTGSQNTSNASALTVQLLRCMNIGGATVPDATVFDAALGQHGAFGVKSSTQTGPVTSHDGAWLLEPPGNQTWGSILPSGTNTILAYGVPVSNALFTKDAPLSGIFDWSTLPKATFASPGVVVGQCTVESKYLQHNPAGPTAEVLGFVQPSCFKSVALNRERAPASFGESLLRFFGPNPAYAALLATTGSGGNKRTLSPFQVIGPDSVELEAKFSWKKSGNTVGLPFSQVQTPVYQIKSRGGTNWLQADVLLWLEAINNQGSFVAMCNNWAFTNADGIAQFPAAYVNKAGGYTLVARTAGTVPNAGIPGIPPGRSLLSTLINVKNGNPGTCITFRQGDATPANPGPNGLKPVGP